MTDNPPKAEGREFLHLLNCSNCGRKIPDPFYSAFPKHDNCYFGSQGNMVRCPCGNILNSLDVVSVQTDFGVRPFPVATGATLTPLPRMTGLKYDKELRFSAGLAFGQGPTFSIKQNKQDLYLISREMPEWKYSIHARGEDNLSFTSDANAKKFGHFQNANSRHIFRMPRVIPPAGHAMRIAIIDIKQPTFNISNKIAKLKSKYKDKLSIQPYFDGLARFELHYTEGDPSWYYELEPLRSASYGIFRPYSNEIFSLVPRGRKELGTIRESFSFSKDIFYVQLGLTQNNTAYISVECRDC